MKLIVFYVLVFLNTSTSQRQDIYFGIDMVFRAWEIVSWYEAFKVFPFPDPNVYSPVPYLLGWYKNDYLKSEYFQNTQNKERKFAGTFTKQGTNFLHPSYARTCNQYFFVPNVPPLSDESEIIKDKKLPYPFKAAAYCLINHLRSFRGNEAINDVKRERTQATKEWKQTLLDRENKYRARHGSPPLTLDRRLCEQAQKWADKMASECKLYHMGLRERADGERLNIGENVGSVFLYNTSDYAMSAYSAVNTWYSEIKNYTYIDELPDLNSKESQNMLDSFGHFTQTVWKETSLVGYGQTCRPQCTSGGGQTKGGCYVTGRYYVGGNRIGKGGFYRINVQKPRPIK